MTIWGSIWQKSGREWNGIFQPSKKQIQQLVKPKLKRAPKG